MYSKTLARRINNLGGPLAARGPRVYITVVNAVYLIHNPIFAPCRAQL